ncbi:hypothetical protein Tco_0022277, partial [Tanacetum coccineum]
AISPKHTLNHHDYLELENNVTNDEIRMTVWDCGSQKAPGQDGFSFLFLKTYWELLKDDVGKAVKGVFDSFKMPNATNSSFLTLIPKTANPIHINDFYPISLIGSYYPKRYWELLPKEILGATTQRDTGSYYPKRYWELLPKERLGCLMVL